MVDYKKTGFKCGIEIHQQLEGAKLFCKCPGVLSKNPKELFRRRMVAVAGETDDVDVAAKYEGGLDKEFVYLGTEENTCLVEFDSEPPHEVNEHALNVALQVAMMLKMELVDEIQIMRKTIINGSVTSGFQRTMLIGRNGMLETSKGVVGIDIVALEEDAARKIKEDSKRVYFNLDRLGIPLIEIATKPDIKDAEHANEVAEKLGMILRSTGKVKRGIGTIRQDVNLSIKDGFRVELKGFQDLRKMPKVIEKEILRHMKKRIKEPEVRRVNADCSTTFLRPMPGSARMYPETDVKSVLIDKKILGNVKIPELISDKASKYEKEFGLKADYARELIKRNISFEDFSDFDLDNNFMAKVLVEYPKELKSRFGLDVSKLSVGDFKKVFVLVKEEKISKGNVLDVLADIIKGDLNLKKYEGVSLDTLEDFVKKLVKEKKGLSMGAYMGIVMGKFKGVDGKKVAGMVKKYL